MLPTMRATATAGVQKPARTAGRTAGRCSDADLCAAVASAAAGDAAAWDLLVRQFSNMVMAVARSCRLNDADVAEVHQVTWLRMVENIGRIERPERIGSWLMTTAKRESLRVARVQRRTAPDHEALLQCPDPDAKPVDAGPIAQERCVAVREAYAQLPLQCQRLLGLMVGSDPLSYKEISHLLSMPIGSIGPTRGRCLDHLRRILDQLEAMPAGRRAGARRQKRPSDDRAAMALPS